MPLYTTTSGWSRDNLEARLDIMEAGVLQANNLAAVPAPGNRVFAIGDSITAGNGTSFPLQLGDTQFLTYVGPLSNSRLNPVGFAAGPGITTATILSTHLPIALSASPKPSACFVQGGTNDAGSFSTISLATTISNLTSCYTQLLNAGIMPILVTNPPRTDSPAGARAALGKINDWIVRYAAQNGLPLVDFFSNLVDSTTGGYLAAYDSGDGIHPKAAGAKLMGSIAASVCANVLPPWGPRLVGYNADPNGHSNPLFLTDGNADGVPDTWNGSLLGTPTVGSMSLSNASLTDSTALGNVWSIQRGSSDLIFTSNGIVTTVGDRVALGMRVFATVPAGGDIDVWIKTNTGVGINRPLTAVTTSLPWSTIYAEGVCSASGFAQCILQVQGASATILRVAQFTFLNLTALGIA
jgi:lysophospholipase L1-like esterase